MYARFATQKIPAGITVIKPDELDKVWYKPHDLNQYKQVHVIGDIHGCYTALREYLTDIDPEHFYIFLGDYLDRGLENVEVLQFLMAIVNLPNVSLLEGNHEIHLWKWANDETSDSKQFEFVTRAQLANANIDKKEVRKLYRRLAQCAFFNFAGRQYLCTHGGISNMPDNLIFMPTQQMIKGVGTYEDHARVDRAFAEHNPGIAQIHGHRNTQSLGVDEIIRSFNLEGGVERGGCLRAVELNSDGTYNIVETSNKVLRLLRRLLKRLPGYLLILQMRLWSFVRAPTSMKRPMEASPPSISPNLHFMSGFGTSVPQGLVACS